jgi:hypothetical protein
MSDNNAVADANNSNEGDLAAQELFDRLAEGGEGDQIAAPQEQFDQQKNEPQIENAVEAKKQEQPPADDKDWRAEFEKLQHRVLSDDGRVAAYQRQRDELAEKLKQLEEGGSSRAEHVQNAQDAEAMLKAIELDYPELANPIKGLIGAAIEDAKKTLLKDVDSRIAPVVEREQRAQAEQTHNVVLQAHEDAYAVLASPDFSQWLAKKPPGIRALYNSRSTDDAIEMLNLYKIENPPAKSAADSREDLLNQSLTPEANRGSSRQPGSLTPEALFDQLANEHTRSMI